MVVSAIKLGLLNNFDEKKFLSLSNAAMATEDEVRIRAIIGISIGIAIYAKRLHVHGKTVDIIKNIVATHKFEETLYTMLVLYVNSLETEKISKEIKEEILPNIVNGKKIAEKLNIQDAMDLNPEWANNPETKQLEENIKKLIDLEKKGSDVYMETFSKMKTYSFFKEVSHWFLPFSLKTSWIKQTDDDSINIIANSLNINPMLCNSDRYSLYFSIASVPQYMKDQMKQLFEGQIDEIKKITGKKIELEPALDHRLKIQQYLQDLYRFFKLFSHRSDFHDPFEPHLELYDIPVFLGIKNRKTMLLSLAGLYIQKNFHSEAEHILNQLHTSAPNDVDIMQRLAFCYQKAGKYSKAVSLYEKTDIIKPNDFWVNKMMANCHFVTGNYGSALNIYKALREKKKDDLRILYKIGQCQMSLGMWEEALPVFFELDYLSPDNTKVQRAISICSFRLGKHETTEKYLQKIPSGEKTCDDWIKQGLLHWEKKRTQDAVDAFVNAVHAQNNDCELIFKLIDEEKTNIIAEENKEDFLILCDEIRYRV